MPKVCYMFAFLLSVVATVAVGEERHLGPHVHGQASVNISTEGDSLDVELSLPGHDAVGFEHPPATKEESAALAKAKSTVEQAAWLVPTSAAKCTLRTHSLRANGYASAPEAGGHADFDADFHFECSDPRQLDFLDVRLTEAFPSLRVVVVNLITGEGSAQQELAGTSTRVSLSQ